LPSQKPVVPQVEAFCAVHCPVGSVAPAVIGVQVPALPCSAHDMHLNPQVVAQQAPCAQTPLPHSVPPPQTAPSGLRPHDPAALQEEGGAQSASAVQDDLHAAEPQANGAQEVASGVEQVPAPSQVAGGVNVAPGEGQLAAAHGVPWTYFWQAPAWHLPFVPQLVPPLSVQAEAGSGAPVATAVQVPMVPVSAQETQEPAQAVAQQIPCAQLPDRHSPFVEQAAPVGLRPHEALVQTFPVEQLASALQLEKQRVPLQM
jgi:hypothetical protein